jgi:hypothetical protein
VATVRAGHGADQRQTARLFTLTTHNLAVLAGTLGLGEQVTAPAPHLADRTLQWVARRMAVRTDNRHAALQTVKNCAYAWRQAVFCLSYCGQNTPHAAAERLGARVREAGLEGRFGPAAGGLTAVTAGARFTGDGTTGAARRFPGWSTGPHWAL